MRIIINIALLGCSSLFSISCAEKEPELKKDDFFVFDFGTEGRMVDRGFLQTEKERLFGDQDTGGYIVSTVDGRFELETSSGGSYALNVLIAEGASTIDLRGSTEKEIFVASSYYDHQLEERVILFVESIGSGDLSYSIKIQEIVDLKERVP